MPRVLPKAVPLIVTVAPRPAAVGLRPVIFGFAPILRTSELATSETPDRSVDRYSYVHVPRALTLKGPV